MKYHLHKTFRVMAVASAIFFSLNTSAQNSTDTQGFSETSTGIKYKIYNGQGGEKPKPGDFIKFDFSYLVGLNDSLLQSSGKMPSYSPLDTGKNAEFSFMEIVPLLSKGDSAQLLISIDSLVNRQLIPAYNATFQKGSNIKCNIKLMGVYHSDSAVEVDYKTEENNEKARELRDIETYMSLNKIKGVLIGNGVYIMIENAGDTSVKAIPGTTASILYKGYLLNGKIFDTNMDSSKGHSEPIDVAVGKHTVIEGWEEALPYFGKGGKGKIFIPAMLGYGPQAMGEDLPAYSNLIFDIEVTDVKQNP